ncbi:class I SAM-dependent methyltransferase [Dissulfurispira sp.]|uniref:class I SAM-dependent methyltransferase n=1 Tax=Dissulfurispira sp. TaxID=2817609 RepID=UPI002FDB0657
MVEVVKEYLYLQGKDIRGASILDIGCFTGEFIYLMSHEGADVFGIELQDEAVEIANERLPGKILKANIMNNDIILPRNQFDIITLLGIIEHVIDPVCLLKKAAELVKPGGLLMIQTPDSASFLARTMGRYWPPYTPIEHIHIFSRRSVSMVLKNLGCKDITIKRHTKKLSLSYVYSMLKVFGPEIYRFVRPFYKIMPDVMTNVRLPFYAGEVILLARF